MSVEYRRTAVLRMLASEERRNVENANLEDMERERERVALRTSEETEETVEETEDETVERTDEETDETDEVTDETDEENVSHRVATEYHGGVCLGEDQ